MCRLGVVCVLTELKTQAHKRTDAERCPGVSGAVEVQGEQKAGESSEPSSGEEAAVQPAFLWSYRRCLHVQTSRRSRPLPLALNKTAIKIVVF